MKRLIYIVYLLLFVFSASAQELIYFKFTTNNGLPSSIVNQVIQAQDHTIWACTVNGVVRFDGNNFQCFDVNSNLPENDIVAMQKSFEDTIWFIGKSGLLSFYQNGTVIPYRHNRKILQLLEGKYSLDKESVAIMHHEVYFNITDKGRFMIDSLGEIKTIYSATEPYNFIDLRSVLKSYYLDNKKDSTVIYLPNNRFVIKTPDLSNRHKIILDVLGSRILLANHNKIYDISKRGIRTHAFETSISKISQNIMGGIFVCFSSDGYAYYPSGNLFEEPLYRSLKGGHVTSVLKDVNGSIWVSTNGQGLYFCASEDFKKVSKEEGLYDSYVSKLTFTKYGLIAVTGNYAISKLKPYNFKNYVFDNVKYGAISDILWHRRKLWVAFQDRLCYFQNGVLIDSYIHKNQDIGFIKSISAGLGHDIWLTCTNGFLKINRGRVISKFRTDQQPQLNVNEIKVTQTGDVWLACKSGLWKYENNKVHKYKDAYNLLSNNIRDIEVDNLRRIVWLGVDDVGIIRLSQDTVKLVASKKEIGNGLITCLYYRDNELWIGSKNGVSKLEYANHPFKRKVVNYSVNHGLLSNEVNDITSNRRYVFVATNRGLCYFDINYRNHNRTTPKVKIHEMKVDGIVMDSIKPINEFGYYTNNISIKYGGIYFKTRGNLKYRYRLLGVDDKWTYTQGQVANYTDLSSGKYTFLVEASNENGVWNNKPTILKIDIVNPFWLKCWFMISFVIVLRILISIYNRERARKKAVKQEMQNKINQYREVALTRQMNPHFIFNSLNAIQHFILQNDMRQSNRFLTKFAKLIRLILDNSVSNFITLDQEIMTLQLYMDLEALRNKDKVDFSINVSPEIDVMNIEVPPMLIQPFVENAIWHGIMNKEPGQKGKISVSFVQNEDLIICKITDNGVGRKKSQEINESNINYHKPKATSITQNRVEVLNKVYQKNISITYQDPVNAEGEALGTIVTITMGCNKPTTDNLQ